MLRTGIGFMRSLVLIGSCALATAALAGDDTPCPNPKKPYMDADGDGIVTRQEFMEGHEKMFDRIDSNGDGKIDESERMARHKHMKHKMCGGCGKGKGMGMGKGAQ